MALLNRTKPAWNVVKGTVSDFVNDRAMQQAAAISFYTMFSLAPLLVIVIAIAGFVWEPEQVRNQLVGEFRGLMGESGSEMIEEILANASRREGAGVIAAIVSIIALFIGSLGVFGQLKSALNTIWNVEPRPGRGVMGFVRDRLLSFAMVMCIAFLLLVSLVVSTAISAVGHMISRAVTIPEAVMQLINLVASFGLITLLFAAMFRILPDAQIRWRMVWIGAASTALLFSLGKYLIGLYLGRASVVSVYGAAGSLALILLWIYYSSIIFFLGAEFTQAYAVHAGEEIAPSPHARWADKRDSDATDCSPRLHPRAPRQPRRRETTA